MNNFTNEEQQATSDLLQVIRNEWKVGPHCIQIIMAAMSKHIKHKKTQLLKSVIALLYGSPPESFW